MLSSTFPKKRRKKHPLFIGIAGTSPTVLEKSSILTADFCLIFLATHSYCLLSNYFGIPNLMRLSLKTRPVIFLEITPRLSPSLPAKRTTDTAGIPENLLRGGDDAGNPENILGNPLETRCNPEALRGPSERHCGYPLKHAVWVC